MLCQLWMAANEPQQEQTLSRTAREQVSVFAIMLCYVDNKYQWRSEGR